MASRAGDEKDSSRRPTRHAARKATARIQAIASPDRTSDSASDMAKNTWNQTLHVDVEDERSDDSQRSMGTRKIKRRARRTVTLPDPAPDQTVHKVARGRTAAHHPSLVQSSIVHVCPIPGCGACFKRREHVKRHVRGIHTLEKPYHCLHNGCGKSFARRDNLGLHYTSQGSQDVKQEMLAVACLGRQRGLIRRSLCLPYAY
ncbi:hypothetical protein FFLO_03273 [Filobasidium floriforme]|uniref:C2H2-type domain-containing protein n=1 Tax=Filobasidium floriforme TaxID=5210 RepID=A0A8K0NQZ4_9TREE|nr:uncharacterized protein HD553DRAFT_143994 [Filobasidium floriforme]KAG7544312.1 hypothetical protein FFLO_03273 [Filobasidium floriforme]KAH8078658.1 hypothetical protein HD553DRAFT_143994 [Filobasidium floriforme]